jgi:hypothetical protein
MGNKGLFGIAVGVVTLVFVVLRLCGVVSWPWLWVLSPLWLYAGLSLCVWLCLVALTLKMFMNRWNR